MNKVKLDNDEYMECVSGRKSVLTKSRSNNHCREKLRIRNLNVVLYDDK